MSSSSSSRVFVISWKPVELGVAEYQRMRWGPVIIYGERGDNGILKR